MSAYPNPARPDEFTVAAMAHPFGAIDVSNLAGLLDEWLGTAGPTSTLIWHRLAMESMKPDPQPFVMADLAAWSGCAPGVVWRAIDRLVTFRRVVWLSGDCLGVEVMTTTARRRVAS